MRNRYTTVDVKEKHIKSVFKKPVKFVLRALDKNDRENVCRWMTSKYILQYSFVVPSRKSIPKDFSNYNYARRYFEMLIADPKRVTFAIILEGKHVGNVGLKEIDIANMRAECFIEIGESHCRGKGVGSLAMMQLLNVAFFNYGLHELVLDVLEFNFPALKVYHRLGFVTQKQNGWHYDEFGQYWRVLRMSVSSCDWINKNKKIS